MDERYQFIHGVTHHFQSEVYILVGFDRRSVWESSVPHMPSAMMIGQPMDWGVKPLAASVSRWNWAVLLEP